MLNLHTEAMKFAKLSNQYRDQVKKGSNEADKTMKEIKEHIRWNAERIARSYNLKLEKKASQISRRRGVPLIALSANKIVSKGDDLRWSDITTFDTQSSKQMNGINFILDYSGSMWYPDDYQNQLINTVEGLPRICAQNFVALCLGVYIQMISKKRILLQYVASAETPVVVLRTENLMNEDWDCLILSYPESKLSDFWSDDSNFPQKIVKAVGSVSYWSNSSDVNAAITKSIAQYAGSNLKNFITMFVTDGGLLRSGESSEDRARYLSSAMQQAKNFAKTTTTVFTFIKLDLRGSSNLANKTVEIVKKMGLRYCVLDNKQQYEESFLTLSNMLNKERR